ncbi:MAG: hypothetical protein NC242_06645 [Roseburia sp.]|nr:hypothetical protein [Roseburia sp.]MCM1429954.1 hypothetical protein [Muribaculaceae bacterium]
MLQNLKRVLAFVCAFALLIAACPVSADAAAKPKFAKTYVALYENGSSGGSYTYTVKNLTKGQTVKWSVSGTGKSYVKLKKTSTKATSTKVTNTLTINTKGKTAAKYKVVKVVAKVYTKAGKLQSTLSAGNAKIKVYPTNIDVVTTSLPDQLLAGKAYNLKYQITPANAIGTVSWTAVRADGTDASDCITKAGVFTPKDEGAYTITVQAMVGKKVYASDSASVTVSTTLLEARQVAADKVVAVYSGNARELVNADSFTVKSTAGVKEPVKDIAFSKDGKEVTLTIYSVFKNGGAYTLTDGTMTREFTTKVGRPALMKVLTTEATVNKNTVIEYGIYDADGIEVSAAYPGTIRYSQPQIINGNLIQEQNQIFMTNIGDTGTFTMTYTCQSDPTLILTAYARIICVAASTSDDTYFTLTTTDAVPDYKAATYADNRKVASGGNYFIHFCALDTDKTELKYDSVKYESSDPDTLMINNRTDGIAKVTAIKTGTVKVLVTAVYGGQTYAYSFDVEVVAPAHLAGLTLDNDVMFVSNSGGYRTYINVAGVDQYGQSYALVGESAQITDNNTSRGMVSYDAAGDRIEVSPSGYTAGSYSYTLTLTAGGQQVSVNFTIVVQTPSYSGAVSYKVDIDNPTLDLALSPDAGQANVEASKKITIRLAEYRGGIFYQYLTIQSARVMKDGMYYSTDLTKTPSSTSTLAMSYGSLLMLDTVDISGGVCTKAPTGTYTVELKYIPQNGSSSLATISAAFTLKDSQASPLVAVTRTTASASCSTALELAKNCLSVADGEITGCTVTGSTSAGKDYKISAGESVNIKSITVQIKTVIGGQTVLSNYTIDVGKTLTNK